ncbi:MAG: hypothetical protein IID45_11890 [Planctomycetes bacterium]|nr:hypothetical protein [Planctomycetota bacterium]
MADLIKVLRADNEKLRNALKGLIPWAGEHPHGPGWATSEAKARNCQMFERALQDACDCFPEDHNGAREAISSN